MKVEPKQMYEFHLERAAKIEPSLIPKMSDLYSLHYGVWGAGGKKPGEQIKLSSEQIKKWLTDDAIVVWALAFGELVGYAIAVHAKLSNRGHIAWITQLVVHKAHRKVDIGKRLLFSIWKFSDYFAWGLLSANPYAVRALEKATRRRCQPQLIARCADELLSFGVEQVHYLKSSSEHLINKDESRVDTDFNLDHSELPEMISNVTDLARPWALGNLPNGWEWFAFTFHDQQQIPLTERELEEMLNASDEITKQAYLRMQSQWKHHPWAQFAPEEVEFILRYSGVPSGSSALDFGCGDGRHALELAKSGFNVTVLDYIKGAEESRRELTERANLDFCVGDCRRVELGKHFDLGICLYDVIGSYTEDRDNFQILKNLAGHIKEGGYVFVSVMNMELTERRAMNWFSLVSDPEKLLSLPPSNIMERSGNVFNPKYYLIDREKRIVYRKEQFREGDDLFEEFIVRDRRYARDEIEHMCVEAGLAVKWSRFVRAGHWDEPLDRASDNAKEILVMCQKPYQKALQHRLFD
jgi:2-polyprenyl-3-methyl-5-hydroxy-6-metoxy-1,4-benzoquinol methylase/GNAT superfamily N-acetyltransferase